MSSKKMIKNIQQYFKAVLELRKVGKKCFIMHGQIMNIWIQIQEMMQIILKN